MSVYLSFFGYEKIRKLSTKKEGYQNQENVRLYKQKATKH